MKIAIVWGMGGPAVWSDENLEIGIGGSEAMMILRARALVALGHEVTCFAPGNEIEHECFGVTWKSLPTWPMYGDNYDFGEDFDALVSLRRAGWGNTSAPPIRALWANDQGCLDIEQAVVRGECNLVITISEHQKQLYRSKYPLVPEEMYFVSSAGVAFDEYAPNMNKKDSHLCLFSSTPERGLRFLIKLWRGIQKEVPEARLRVTGGFELYGMTPRQAIKLSEGLYGTVSYLPNAKYLGPIARSELVSLQCEASLLLYPSTYEEMCCITALEMHAAGCAIVTTDRAALSERVRDGVDGYLIPGSPGTPAYDEFFLERAMELLQDPRKCKEMGRAGREAAQKYNHTTLAEQWIERFERM